MSRLYGPGLYAVRVEFTHDGARLWDLTSPMTYEDAQQLLLGFGLGIPFEFGLARVRVERARIVPT